MSRLMILGLLGVVLLVAGCNVRQTTAPPQEITLENALSQVGAGLRAMHDAAHLGAGLRDKPFGLLTAEATVTFNIEASETNRNQLVISGSAAPPAVSAGLGLEGKLDASREASGRRGNTIVIRFLNPVYAPTGTAAYAATTQPADGGFAAMLQLIFEKMLMINNPPREELHG